MASLQPRHRARPVDATSILCGMSALRGCAPPHEREQHISRAFHREMGRRRRIRVLYSSHSMCRLIGIAANEATEFRIVLREAPRSLAFLSREHRDGWGIAVFDSESGTWQLDKGIACAGEDERFHRLAVGTRGHLL